MLIKNPGAFGSRCTPCPHTSGNVKADEVKISRRLLFRNKPDAAVERRYVSNDSYAVTGLVKISMRATMTPWSG